MTADAAGAAAVVAAVTGTRPRPDWETPSMYPTMTPNSTPAIPVMVVRAVTESRWRPIIAAPVVQLVHVRHQPRDFTGGASGCCGGRRRRPSGVQATCHPRPPQFQPDPVRIAPKCRRVGKKSVARRER